MILIIAEKPSVAGEIAKVIGATKREKGYLSGGNYLVSWCIGHLVELSKPEAYGEELKKWDLGTLPIIPQEYLTEISASTADQFKVLKGLMNRSDVMELICATDAGREGELIFRLVYDKIGCKKPFKRLWISSMEEKSIKDGLENMKPGYEYDNLYHAALCRQRADWLVGINFTRLYSKIYNKTLTCGRVQTPTINLIVERQREIENFIPQIYYSLVADMGSFKAYTKVTKKENAQEIVSRCTGKEACVMSVEQQVKKENPPALYDLTTLQRDANRILGYSAQQTLNHLQSLYDNKLATYPRTDSRYITADQEDTTQNLLNELLQTGIFSTLLANQYDSNKINMKRIINDKKVTDHHAILPTGSITKEKYDALPFEQKNILLLISYRLLSAVYLPYTYTATKAILDIEGEAFTATGREVLESGFKEIEDELKKAIQVSEEKDEKTDNKDIVLPAMAEGNKFDVIKIIAEEKKTQPPKSYTEDTLLSAMETVGKDISDAELKEAIKDSGLGTPATRASIIENIIKIGYIKRDGKKLIPEDMAYTFIDIISDEIKKPELTAEWEKQLADIQHGEINEDIFMNQIIEFISSLVNETKAAYSPEQSSKVFETQKESLGSCPILGKRLLNIKSPILAKVEKMVVDLSFGKQ